MTLYVGALLLWSALHLLWEGALVAVLFAWWEREREPTPSARYHSALACILVLVAAFAGNAIVTHVALVANARLGGAGAPETGLPVAAAFDSLTLLVWLWAIGAGTHAIRLGIGAWHFASVRRHAVAAPAELVRRVESLACSMGTGLPQVLVAKSRSGPFVMQRVLMLPSDWELGEELDAVVLHELAHLRRRDVESNAVLRAIQVVLWFHPAVWSLVRSAVNAREEACDVESVARSSSALVLARALVKLEEQRQSLGASDGALVVRVQRLIAGTHGTSHGRSFILAPIVVLLVGGVLAARLAPRNEQLVLVGAGADALPVERMVITARDPAGQFTVTLLNGRVAGATIAGVPVERGAMRRRDRTLVLADVVTMELDPRGSIRWMPRVGVAVGGR